jgi:2-desacetyl-2-hydroxyethyl bacteriochlorophyllide A dehydrogenase
MKILKVVEPGKFEFEDIPIPIPAQDEILLKMAYCGICGSDIKVFKGEHPYATYPRIMGHEISAVTIQQGNKRLQPKLVAINPYFNCGNCNACLNEKQNCCLKNQTMGVQRDGAYAQYIVVPQDKIIYSAIELNAKQTALTEPFSVADHAINRVGVEKDNRILIFGAGPIGMFCMIIAKNKGAKVTIVDHHDYKLQKATMIGAENRVNSKTISMNTFFQTSTCGIGYDICIDATGSKDAIENCFKFVKTGGEVLLIGHSKEEIPMPHSDIIKKELTIFASRNSLNFIRAQGEIKNTENIESVITDIVPFKDVPKFFERLVAKDDRIIKALIEF